MKCPSCSSTISDLRDVCPICRIDLRSEKSALGLSAANPNASHEEILSRMGQQGPSSMRGADEEILDLFDIAAEDIARNPSPESIEIASSAFIDLKDRQDIEVLFAIAFESLTNPDADKALKAQIPKSAEKNIISARGAFDMKMAATPSAEPTPASKPALAKKIDPTIIISPEEMVLVRPIDRLIVFLVDWSIIALSALALTLVFSASELRETPGVLAGLLRSEMDRLRLFSGLLSLAALISPAYFVSVNLMYGMTLGERFKKLIVLSTSGHGAQTRNLLVRGMIMPLGILALGAAPLVFGAKRGLSDLLAKTSLCVDTANRGRIISITASRA